MRRWRKHILDVTPESTRPIGLVSRKTKLPPRLGLKVNVRRGPPPLPATTKYDAVTFRPGFQPAPRKANVVFTSPDSGRTDTELSGGGPAAMNARERRIEKRNEAIQDRERRPRQPARRDRGALEYPPRLPRGPRRPLRPPAGFRRSPLA